MRLLPDTHLLLWAVGRVARLPPAARDLMADPGNKLFFSAVSIWEIAIKRSLGRPGFATDPRLVRSELLAQDYEELPITSDHGVVVDGLAFIHKDPFDRLLVAQAMVEGVVLLTSDARIARYPGPIQKV
jgi:PIN domain nuclease of toxin-antitoxin system